ncbi:hypothetical protein QAD02_016582 [Eretmocerus hayati]|uniref:Uncharacterized protein n=1 Tax=Eretmocerus hayati TaxID=131215 RepID=A0ACC2PBK4_9HYME|nr:hypothetical protein QAD02_016582 [Eretmocerus hayati]
MLSLCQLCIEHTFKMVQTSFLAASILLLVTAAWLSTAEKILFTNPNGGPGVELDVEALVRNKTFVDQQFKCLLNSVTCDDTVTPIIKGMILKALFHECQGCTEPEKKAYAVMKPILTKEYSREMNLVMTNYGLYDKYNNVTQANKYHGQLFNGSVV